MEHLSKFVHFVPFKHPFTTPNIMNKFLQEIIHLHNYSRVIIIDHDHIFLSIFGHNYFICKALNSIKA